MFKTFWYLYKLAMKMKSVFRCFYLTIMAVNMNGKNYCITCWWIIAYTKLVFLILLHQPVFENFRLFFIQFIFMYEVRKSPKHSGSESSYMYRCCAVPETLWSCIRLPEISNFFLKIGDSYFIAATESPVRLEFKPSDFQGSIL